MDKNTDYENIKTVDILGDKICESKKYSQYLQYRKLSKRSFFQKHVNDIYYNSKIPVNNLNPNNKCQYIKSDNKSRNTLQSYINCDKIIKNENTNYCPIHYKSLLLKDAYDNKELNNKFDTEFKPISNNFWSSFSKDYLFNNRCRHINLKTRRTCNIFSDDFLHLSFCKKHIDEQQAQDIINKRLWFNNNCSSINKDCKNIIISYI